MKREVVKQFFDGCDVFIVEDYFTILINKHSRRFGERLRALFRFAPIRTTDADAGVNTRKCHSDSDLSGEESH